MKKFLIIICIILIISLGGACAYMFISLQNSKSEINNLNAQYEEKLSKLNVEQTETEKKETTEETKKMEIVAFDKTKSKANSNYNYSLCSRSCRGIVASLSNDGTVSILLKNETKSLFPNMNESLLSKELLVNQFADKVVDIQIVSIAQYESDSALLFLLKNNKVQYLTLKDICVNGNLKPKTIDNLSNIIRIDGATVIPKQTSEPFNTPIAIDNEGYFYDLNEYID